MSHALPEDRMPEAEVALRLAFHLLASPSSQGTASVAIDGAQIRVHGSEVFPIESFLRDRGWKQIGQEGKNDWQGSYEKGEHRLVIQARSGEGDVRAQIGSRRVRAECKGGPRIAKPGSREYPILHGALGQAITAKAVKDGDVLVVAVPGTDRFRTLADRWCDRRLLAQSGIQIVLVSRKGRVDGLLL